MQMLREYTAENNNLNRNLPLNQPKGSTETHRHEPGLTGYNVTNETKNARKINSHEQRNCTHQRPTPN